MVAFVVGFLPEVPEVGTRLGRSCCREVRMEAGLRLGRARERERARSEREGRALLVCVYVCVCGCAVRWILLCGVTFWTSDTDQRELLPVDLKRLACC
eukprot:3916249-Rhodomonas_salina.2